MALLERLTYCTNVHPAESLPEVERALSVFTEPVKRRVSPDQPFDVGLRLSARAALELDDAENLARFRELLSALDLTVSTLNGFPFGAFHGERVKEAVYRPDWQEPARLAYTENLARVLDVLLPSGGTGSISTLPGCFGPRVSSDSVDAMARALLEAVACLVELERRSGKCIVLALEPEPSCFLETTAQTLDFFREQLWAPERLTELGRRLGLQQTAAELLVRRHLGVCLDACHAAVEHESAWSVYRALVSAGIVVGKIQVSAGLALRAPDAAALAELARYDEPVYLHQVVIREGEQLRRYLDLGQAIAQEPGGAGEWRVHFHVPVFHDDVGAFGSTQRDLVELLDNLGRESASVHLEVETYTWDVLPRELRERPLVDAIAEEIHWTRRHWGAPP